MKRKKLIIAAVVMLLVFLIGGAIAYFTDHDEATNVFTIGSVKITLSEPNWDPEDAEDLMPNAVVPKDPVVKNDSTKGSTSPAYVFVKVEVPCYTTAATANPASTTYELFTFTPNSEWTQLSHTACATSSQKAEYVFYYGTGGTLTPLAVDATTTSAVFDEVTLANIDGSETLPQSVEMPVTAYGIQTEGLGTNPTPATVYGNF